MKKKLQVKIYLTISKETNEIKEWDFKKPQIYYPDTEKIIRAKIIYKI